MWSKRMRFLLTIACVVASPLLLASPAASQGYGGLDDDGHNHGGGGGQQFGSAGGGNQQQQQFGGQSGYPQNQQISSLPQYESAEQHQPGDGHNHGFSQQPQQQQYGQLGAGGHADGAQQQQQQGRQQQPNMWWQGQNAFQQPAGHPGVQQLAPSAQAPPQQQAPANQNYNYGSTTPGYNAYGTGGGAYTTGAPAIPQQSTYNPPPPPPPAPTQQPAYNPPPQPQTTSPPYSNPPPPPPPVPQEPPVQQYTDPPPVPQQQPTPAPYNPPPPPPPQQPAYTGGWNAPQSQQAPAQNFAPQGQAPPQPPPQNYQPPPQYQQPQQPYQPPPQQQYQPSIPPPNQAYRPPPPQQPTSRPYTPAPYKPPQTPRPNNPYQSSQQSSSNFQQPRPQPQRPYTPPQTPRPRPQQHQQQQYQPQPQENTAPYPGCPAAMKCVQDDYCNAIGVMEDAPIQFSAADRLHRVALMECSEPMTGIVGVCCRDPNYKDPWPDMKAGGGQQHHPDKGHSQGHHQSFQPPQGNHLQSGSGNPYSGTKLNNDDATTNNKKTSKSLKHNIVPFSAAPLSSPNLLSESKQTLQVLEPCSADELCLSMSQCHSLNPQFMAKTGLNPADKHNNNIVNINKQSNNDSEPVKIKRCKYERSGIHYLCCKKPNKNEPSSSSTSPGIPTTFQFTPARFTPTTIPVSTFSTTTQRPTTTAFSSPGKFTIPFAFPSSSSTTPKSGLISGFGLRFHSGLHTANQKELNSRKPNPYGNNEEPIQLISPVEKTTGFTFLNPATASHQFRFTTTTTTPAPVLATKSNAFHQTISTQQPSPASISAFARIIGTSRTYFSTTVPSTTISQTTTAIPTANSPSVISHTSVQINNDTVTKTTIPATTPSIPTTTEGKVDISKIPISVPLRPEIKAEPPIGFVFKGEDLYIPNVELPSQNYLVPINDFEARTFPTEPPVEEEERGETAPATEVAEVTSSIGGGGEVQDNNKPALIIRNSNNKRRIFTHKNPFLHNNSIEGTTIYSILDESSGSQERAAG